MYHSIGTRCVEENLPSFPFVGSIESTRPTYFSLSLSLLFLSFTKALISLSLSLSSSAQTLTLVFFSDHQLSFFPPSPSLLKTLALPVCVDF